VAFLYLLTLLSLRNSIRKGLGFRRPRTREPITFSFPARFLFPKRNQEGWWMPTFFMAGFYGYSLYKIMRKHHAIKHKVRFLNFICTWKWLHLS
jgi:hypothetical protein